MMTSPCNRLAVVAVALVCGVVMLWWTPCPPHGPCHINGSCDLRGTCVGHASGAPCARHKTADAAAEKTAPSQPTKETEQSPDTRESLANPPGKRSPRWAKPLIRPGLPNFYQVSPDLYRGAQPTAAGMAELKKLGIRTVVNLRTLHSDRDRIDETRLAYEHIYFNPLHPEDEDIVRFLQIVTDKKRTPVFVHCAHGADRTGTMCAMYRIMVQGWTKTEAVEEMSEGGYGFHEVYQNLLEYIRKLDVADIRRRAGIAAPTPAAAEPQGSAPRAKALPH